MARKEVHVVRNPKEGWDAKKTHADRVSAHCATQAEAISRARDICINQGAECVIHDRTGKIRNSNSYGNYTCPPKEKK
jgi:hypothetical protein